MNDLAPICLFVYNRPWHTRQTLEFLKKNPESSESEIYVFSDGPKNEDDEKAISEVREIFKNLIGFKKVHLTFSSQNRGLAKSIIRGVTAVLAQHDQLIVLEDDLLTSPHFLRYMNQGLNLYKDDLSVASIHAYIYPVDGKLPQSFFLRGADCWGWATYKRAWTFFEEDGQRLLDELQTKELIADFNFNNSYPYSEMLQRQIQGLNNSWAIRWYASAYLNNMYTLYPGETFVQNIGLDGTGTHGKSLADLNSKFTTSFDNLSKIQISEDISSKKIISDYFKSLSSEPRNKNYLKILYQFLKSKLGQ